MRQPEACSESEPMPAEDRTPLASKDALARGTSGPTEPAVAARGSPGNVEEEGFPAGGNPSLC